ncbi:MAG: hypothetical protein GWP61_26085 [Chloroflexi bacterium]|nr:hypothetical protein [Chloroflexota bacterium]
MASEWVGSLRLHAVKESQTKYQASWLSLDENDNDLARFLTYFIAALNQNEGFESPLGEGVLSVLQSSQSAPTEAFLTSLINEITAIPNRMIFVLDDYHVISSSEVDEALIFLLEHLPQQLHLAVVTRKDPNLPFARLRARGQLTELRAIDLRFSTSEAAKFFNEIMSLNLAEEDITALDSQTEGWIAGLQLAAISMQGQKDTTRLIKSFTGSHRFVLDYLIEEVLNQQHVSVQTFLLQTAILRRLTGSLCDALTGEDNGQETLERLEHANLFIIPLDEERRWYRYHHLFAELLQQRLKHTYPNLIRDLHSKAAGWHETNGDFHEAIHHAIAMDDTKTATRLIEKGALEALERSDLRFILNWVDRLPDTALESSPWLFLYHTWALLISGQVDVAASRLENTEWILELNSADESRKQEMFGYIAGSKALLCLWQRDYENGINLANQALEKLPENHWVRGYCAIVLGGTFAGVGNLGEAISAFVESSSVGKASGNKLLEVSSACNHAYVLELEGHLQQAIKIYQDAFLIAERDGREIPVAGYIYIDLARLLYELDELGLASQHLKKGNKLCRQLMDGRAEKIGHLLLARVQLAQGDVVNALNSIKNAEKAYPGQETSFDLRGGEYAQIRLWLKEKNL